MASIADKSVLITGAGGGIGRALVDEALRRGAARVYAADLKPLTHPDERVEVLSLDVTDVPRLEEAAAGIESLDILVNNAGIAIYDDLSERAVIEKHLAVNLFGVYGVTQAFLPLLTQSKGTLVNNLSLNALAPLPIIPAYSISKAAAFSLTQSLRTLLAPRGISVHAVLTGPVDTEMTIELNIPKTPPASVAHAIFEGVEKDEEDIFPDPASESGAEAWRGGAAKSFERQFAQISDADRVKP